MDLLGGIEAGGTKVICAIGTPSGEIVARDRFPTSTPDQTLARAAGFFSRAKGLRALGIGSFGPLDLEPGSPTFGRVVSSPKPGWTNCDWLGPLRRALNVPIALDTDVNVAGFGEWRRGAARGLETFLYLTVGTGIGGGGMIHGRRMHGLTHPEMGHVLIPHDEGRDPFPGSCPFHGDCLEGLASGPALEQRWGASAESLAEDHRAWRLEAHYLGLAVAGFIYTISPQRVILGGGVMRREALLPMICQEVEQLLGGYGVPATPGDGLERYIVAPELGEDAGIFGALELAAEIYLAGALMR